MSKYPFRSVEALEPGQFVTWDRSMVEEQNRGTHIVHEDDVGSVITDHNRAKRIATGNLTGCTAVAVVLQRANTREAYIQHFHQIRHELGALMLNKFVNDRQAVDFDRSRAVIMAPGTSADFWRELLDQNYSPYRPEVVEELASILSRLPSQQHHTAAVTYPNNLRVPHNLVVELPRYKEPVISVSRSDRTVVIPAEIPISTERVA